MKVALIVPEFLSGSSFLQQPLGLLLASTLLEKNGHDVSILDVRTLNIKLDNLIKKVKDMDLIFLTTSPYDQVQNYFVDYRYAYAVSTANYLKKHLPEVPLVICGAHGTVRPDLIIRDINPDIIIQGEYEYTILNIVNQFKRKKILIEVPNIIYKHQNKIIKNKTDEKFYHPDLKNNIFPAYDKIDMLDYYGNAYINNIPIRKRHWAVVQGSRGCPYSCSYCHNFWGKKIRKRSPQSIVEEMELLEKKYKVREIFFIDFTFTLNKQWVFEICELIIKKNLNVYWTIETRCDCLSEDLLKIMKQANCKNIWLGIENFNNEILAKNRKGYTSEIILPTIKLIKDSGINPQAFIMLGMPGETRESLNYTIKKIYELKISYTKSIMICTPRHNTEYYELAKSQFPFIDTEWYDLNIVKGQIANNIKPYMFEEAITIMRNRNFVNMSICPQIEVG